MADKPTVYRDYCNTCGAKRDEQHKPRCHVRGVVGAWSGIQSLTPAKSETHRHLED